MRAWDNLLSLQEKRLGKETVDKWLRPLKVTHFDACNLYLEASDTFQISWFEEHLRKQTDASFINNNNKKIKVHLVLAADAKKDKAQESAFSFNLPQETSQIALEPFSFKFDSTDPWCRFENFIQTEENHLSYQVLFQAAGQMQKEGVPALFSAEDVPFNPIYLFGDGGSGKTHLLMSFAQALQHIGLNAIYIRAETFTEHVINAIRAGEMQAFRKAYRTIDALLIDDIQIFSRKGATQEELFHTFNALHAEGKQIVLASDVPPKELKEIEARLVSRFEWGIALQIHPLKAMQLKELLQLRSHFLHYPLSDEVRDFFLSSFQSAKGILRALDTLILRHHIYKGSASSSIHIALESVKKYLADLIADEKKVGLSPQQLIQIVGEHYGIRIQDIVGKSQSRECVLPRKIAMFLCRSELQLPFMKIGDIFQRDHSTVISSVKYIQKACNEKNGEIVSTITALIKQLQRQLGWDLKNTNSSLLSSSSVDAPQNTTA